MRSRWFLPVCLTAALVGCDGDSVGDAGVDAGDPTVEAARREVLANLADGVILPTLRDFAERAAALEAATATLETDPSDANRTAAQAAFREAMLVWEQAEVMQVGPAGMGGTECPVIGGMDLRDEVYSWNLTSECRIDQETVDQTYQDPTAFAAELVNVRGLDALEYLLFVDTANNDCTDISPINADGTWAALGETEVRARRAAYAHAAASAVSQQAASLRDLWEPSSGGFATSLATAGDAGSAYPSTQSAFNDMGGAMLYIDVATRDMKLGEPAGIAGCLTDTCFEQLELPHARFGLAAILENLRGFQRLFLGEQPGTTGLGWDDVLVDMGADAIATEITNAVAAAIAAIEALGTDSLEEAVTANRAAVMTAYDAIGDLQRLFKADVFTILDIEPTTCRIGDND